MKPELYRILKQLLSEQQAGIMIFMILSMTTASLLPEMLWEATVFTILIM